MGEGWLRAVGWTLLSHHRQGLSFLPFYRDIFSYRKQVAASLMKVTTSHEEQTSP